MAHGIYVSIGCQFVKENFHFPAHFLIFPAAQDWILKCKKSFKSLRICLTRQVFNNFCMNARVTKHTNRIIQRFWIEALFFTLIGPRQSTPECLNGRQRVMRLVGSGGNSRKDRNLILQRLHHMHCCKIINPLRFKFLSEGQ